MKILSDLRTWLDSTATKISKEEGDPERWDTPLLYLLEQLEKMKLNATKVMICLMKECYIRFGVP